MIRLVIEEPCPDCGKYEHARGESAAHHYVAPMRTIIDPSDPHRIEAAAQAIHEVTLAASDGPQFWMDEASAAVAAFLDPEDKDTYRPRETDE